MDSFVPHDMPAPPHVRPASAADALSAFEIVSPFSARTLFWRARHLTESDMLRHLPFLFWLLGTARPARYVELGMTDAVAYFAVCQALDKLEPNARCVGYGAWGAQGIPSSVRCRNDELYAEFSRLHPDTPEDAVRRVRDGTVDLMLIHAGDRAETVETQLSAWTPKLSDRAVILICGTDKAGFLDHGGNDLLTRCGAQYPLIHFDEGPGLTVLLRGGSQTDKLRKLAELEPEDMGYQDVRHVFARLGKTHYLEWAAQTDSGCTSDQASALVAAKMRPRTLGDDITTRRTARNQACDAQSDRIAGLEKDLDTALRRRDTLKSELADIARAAKTAETEFKARLSKATTELARQRHIAEAARAEAEEMRAKALAIEAALGSRLAECEAEAARHRKMADAARGELDRARSREDAILHSTSWRVTAPMRGALNLLRTSR